ncbi:conserved hypothetical protein [Talaromyces stipitatus ATCC 10500]|uniref:HTH CENPB-type domain-containing protein n=1 Tax=Talaromyces stipitatus (strain ATCC 10500 / CBS 375.48 / QM 6759 / NRRL 1006) TaxID=441959 RepID=B8M3K9_TALSN|nr:uncharacterized protein TSTA_096300 [Talaromyces stipitatus ATCC 10500]EED22381.1 conserved hypothetical protein [Talaromyces stipitatus ATCC 10500]
MPPIRTGRTQNSSNQEGRNLIYSSSCTDIYDVPFTTLQRRLTGTQYRGEKRANGHILTQYEEESLLKWILDLDKRGLPPRPSLVQDMADLLLSQHGSKHVSEKWVYRFVDRHPEVKLRFSRRYNYERAKCEDIKIIQEHFNRVREVIQEYGILSEDIYNFDETGFAMGLCATAKVITGSDRYARPNLLQPGNREWVTAIEAVNSTGWALPSYMIFKATTIISKAGLRLFHKIGDLILVKMAGQQMRLEYDGFKNTLSLIQQAVRRGDTGCLFLMAMEAI